ncbi:MAG: hypothetical protein KDD60_11805 [Bdellovibrionales bacterium]|nr:hypothetical protein [Bdellovibrionales bacterium]
MTKDNPEQFSAIMFVSKTLFFYDNEFVSDRDLVSRRSSGLLFVYSGLYSGAATG